MKAKKKKREVRNHLVSNRATTSPTEFTVSYIRSAFPKPWSLLSTLPLSPVRLEHYNTCLDHYRAEGSAISRLVGFHRTLPVHRFALSATPGKTEKTYFCFRQDWRNPRPPAATRDRMELFRWHHVKWHNTTHHQGQGGTVSMASRHVGQHDTAQHNTTRAEVSIKLAAVCALLNASAAAPRCTPQWWGYIQ